MSRGIDLMCKNQNGSNALHIAVKKDNIHVIQTLLDIHYPLDYTKNNGVTACGIASYKGSLKILDMLYKAGADINITAKNGIGPLYLAIKSNKLDCVKYLIERKALTHFQDPIRSEFSPLFFIIKNNYLDALEVICDGGTNIDIIKNA